MKHKEALITFLAIAAVVGGIVILLGLWKDDNLGYYWAGTVAGILLLAGGLTVGWTRSRFFRG